MEIAITSPHHPLETFGACKVINTNILYLRILNITHTYKHSILYMITRQKMKTGKLLLILMLTLSLISCKSPQETKAIAPTAELDFLETKKNSFPAPLGIINDYGNVFTESQRTELSKMLYNYDIETTRQIAIITIEDIKPYKDIQKYATDIGNEWGVGSVEKDNGLVLVLCPPLKQIGISTGLGTEQVLTDEVCKKVFDNVMIPEFKNGNYYEGIKKGVNELMAKWK